jgi:hypothetical protein
MAIVADSGTSSSGATVWRSAVGKAASGRTGTCRCRRRWAWRRPTGERNRSVIAWRHLRVGEWKWGQPRGVLRESRALEEACDQRSGWSPPRLEM